MRREPVFNIPGVVTAMLGLIVVIHVARLALNEADDSFVVLAMAFIPDRYTAHPLAWPGGALSAWISPITHMLLHGDATHLALNGASLAAFGAIIARRVGSLRFLLFTIVCGVAGASTFLAFNWGVQAPLIGASGAIAGMMAVALRLLFSAIDVSPNGFAGDLIRRAPQLVPMKSIRETLMDRRMQSATAIWLLINLLAAYGMATPAQAGVVAWEAHIGGYFVGLLSFGLFDRPARYVLEDELDIPAGLDDPNRL
jgi:membrane associated rhomboid family serine protease